MLHRVRGRKEKRRRPDFNAPQHEWQLLDNAVDHAWWTKGLETPSSRSLLEGKRPVEITVVRFSS
jgi:hypothetical protein